ncbi:MAG: hypothetical protein KKD44_26950 [Proteobacteria bacterium]|nr:hypothetical protein [Pseudomonadota bacterium]
MNNLPCFHIQTLCEGTVSIECSSGDVLVSSNLHEILEFIIRNPSDYAPSTPRLVWRTAELVAHLRPLMPDFAIKMLDNDPHRAIWDEYRLYHNPGVMFQVNVNHNEVLVYSLKKHLPDGHPTPNNIDELMDYADRLVSDYESIGVNKISQMYSPVAVMEDAGLLKDAYDSLPTFKDIPDGCLDYAMEVSGMLDTRREWNDCYQVGYFPELWSADISSCYGYHASKLPNLDGATYKHSKNPVDSANFGFLKGELTINPKHPFAFCSPIVFPVGNTVSNPAGTLQGHFSLEQVRFIERNGMGTFVLKDGWWITAGKGERPLAGIVDKFYKARVGTSPTASYLLKRAITGIIGRMGEWRRPRGQDYQPGPYFNPVYRAYIMTNASLQVGQFLINHQITPDELVLVGVDGFYSTRHLQLPPVSDLGKWRDAGSLRLLIASFNTRFKDEACDKVLDEIKANPDTMVYPSLDLSVARAQVDRSFKRYPKTGREMLKKNFVSEAIIL